jgi:hypothetical protein
MKNLFSYGTKFLHVAGPLHSYWLERIDYKNCRVPMVGVEPKTLSKGFEFSTHKGRVEFGEMVQFVNNTPMDCDCLEFGIM